jgi:hypothetical protein
MKFSRADSSVKMWRFSYVSVINSVLPNHQDTLKMGMELVPETSENLHIFILDNDTSRCAQVFQKCRRHFQILGARRVMWIKCHAQDPQFWSDLQTSQVSGALPLGHVTLDTFVCKDKRPAVIMLKMSGPAVQGLVARATRPMGIVNCLLAWSR